MARPKGASGSTKRMLAFSEWLYALFLHAYPTSFRRAYGSRMTQVFRDSCRDALQQHNMVCFISFWFHTLFDLVSNAYLEQWQALKEGTRSMSHTRSLLPRQWVALATTFIAFAISLLSSVNLYLIEDTSSLTQAAYGASPLLRFSYSVIYCSALAAGVAICVVAGYVFVRRSVSRSALYHNNLKKILEGA